MRLLNLETKQSQRLLSNKASELFCSFSLPQSTSLDLAALVSTTGTVPIFSLKMRRWISRLQSKSPIEAATFVGNHIFTCSSSIKTNTFPRFDFRYRRYCQRLGHSNVPLLFRMGRSRNVTLYFHKSLRTELFGNGIGCWSR